MLLLLLSAECCRHHRETTHNNHALTHPHCTSRYCGRGEDKLDLQGWRRVRPGRKVRERTNSLPGQLYRNIKHDLCLDYSELHSKGMKVLRCDMDSPYQRFQFQYFTPSP